MFKRCCAIVMTMVLFIGYVFTNSVLTKAASDTITQSGDWGYTVANDGTAVINEYYGTDIAVEIPNEVDGYSVTKLGNSVFYGNKLSSVVLPNSVTSIGTWAFTGCSNLSSVSLSENLTSIGAYAFHGCSNLTSITIPSSVTTIGMHAFYECNKLKNVYITDIKAWCQVNCVDRYSSPLSNYGTSLYLEGEKLTQISLPEGLTQIRKYTFLNCSSLTDVVFPNSVRTVEESAFEGCKNLKKLILPNSVTRIEQWAFVGCSSLTNITLPDCVSHIGYGAFSNCSSLRDIGLPENLQIISEHAFSGCSALTNIVIPNNITHIEEYAFYECGNLAEALIPSSVLCVERAAFAWCHSLTIYGETDSYIQTYATENEIPFKHVYWVTYDASGGMEAPTTHVKLEDKSVNLSENIPIYAEHKFLGWSTYPAGEIEYFPGENYNENADLELYAVWDAGHTVTYDANGGTNAPTTQKKYYGDILQLSMEIPTRSGYVFKGWSTEPTGDILYQPGMNYEKDEDITLYAIWAKTYYVAYDTNGGSEILTTQYFEVNETVQISQKIPSRIGYIFLGWSDTPSGEVNFQPGDFYSQNKDVTLYAIWEKGFIVTYDDNWGSGPYCLEDQIKRKGETLILTDVIPLRTGYIFSGWSTTPDGPVVYASSAAYKEDSDITLHARWVYECNLCDGWGYLYEKCLSCGADGTIKEFVSCTTCDGFGKVLTTKTETVPCLICEETGTVWENNYTWYKCLVCNGKGSYRTENEVQVKCPTCNGFKGGLQEVDCSKCYGGIKSEKDCPGCGNRYTVSYSANGGEGAPQYQYKKEDIALALRHEIPVREGFQFRGWATSSSSVIYQPGATYLDNEKLNLYAVWTRFGDFNSDELVTDADALYLLYHTIFGNSYPIEQNCDYNNDGEVTDSDALYLLYHTIFGDSYPLN